MKIAASQSDLEKIILRYVSHFSYHYWTSGIVPSYPPEKIDRLSKKFAELYGTLRAPHWRSYQKRKGLTRAFCVAYRLPNSTDYKFYLLATDGIGNVRSDQRMSDARDKPIEVGDLRLLQMTRPKALGGGTRWTWQVDWAAQTAHDKHLLAAVKEGNARVLADGLKYIQGYSMHSAARAWVRHQIKSKAALWKKVWPQKPWPGPDPEASLPVVRLTKIKYDESLGFGDRPGSPDQRKVN